MANGKVVVLRFSPADFSDTILKKLWNSSINYNVPFKIYILLLLLKQNNYKDRLQYKVLYY